MNEKDAIRVIEGSYWRYEGFGYGDISFARDMAVEALEKQIPKKPTHECTLIRKFTCPRCKNVHEVKTPYCCFCGQKLDW